MRFFECDVFELPGYDNTEPAEESSQIRLNSVTDNTEASLTEHFPVDTLDVNVPRRIVEEHMLKTYPASQLLAPRLDDHPPRRPFSVSGHEGTLASFKHLHKRQKLMQYTSTENNTAIQQPVSVAQTLEQVQRREWEQRFCPMCHMGEDPEPHKTSTFKYFGRFEEHIIRCHINFFLGSSASRLYTCRFCPCPCESPRVLSNRQFPKKELINHLWAFHNQSSQQYYSPNHRCFQERTL